MIKFLREKYLEAFNLFFKGILIGIVNIIPGVSGGTLALILGIYYRLITAFSELALFKNIKKNILFLSPIALGVIFAGISISRILTLYVISNEVREGLMLIFFSGIIFASLGSLYKDTLNLKDNLKLLPIRKLLLFTIGFIFVSSLLVLNYYEVSFTIINRIEKSSMHYYFLLFLAGAIAGAAMILPGISGSALMLVLGVYNEMLFILEKIKIAPLTSFIFGEFLGIIAVTTLIKVNIEKNMASFMYFSLGLIAGSLLQVLQIASLKFKSLDYNLICLILLMFLIGALVNSSMQKIKEV